MSSQAITVQGYIFAIASMPDNQARVAIRDDEQEYYILPRGAGVDLDDLLSTLVSVTGIVIEKNNIQYLQVRAYTVLDDDDHWLDDNE